jgi:hemoglobin
MMRIAATMLSLALSLGSGAARAESTLYAEIGGRDVLVRTVDEFVGIMQADDRINFAFAEADLTKFKGLLVEQLCSLTGGPCRYTGRSMRAAHAKLDIDNAMFNALAEDLYKAFDRVGVPYRLQNRVVALLAPMQREIVK